MIMRSYREKRPICLEVYLNINAGVPNMPATYVRAVKDYQLHMSIEGKV